MTQTVENPVLATPGNKPTAGPGEIAVVIDSVWQVLPDLRGKVAYAADGTPHQLSDIGPLPEGLSLIAPAPTLEQARATQAALIDAAYAAAITDDIIYTSQLGTTQTFQADAQSQDVLLKAVIGYGAAGAVPLGFFWKSADNMLVPFTLDDVRGLYAAMLARGWAAFQKRTALKQDIASSPTPAACQAITWSPLP